MTENKKEQTKENISINISKKQITFLTTGVLIIAAVLVYQFVLAPGSKTVTEAVKESTEKVQEYDRKNQMREIVLEKAEEAEINLPPVVLKSFVDTLSNKLASKYLTTEIIEEGRVTKELNHYNFQYIDRDGIPAGLGYNVK